MIANEITYPKIGLGEQNNCATSVKQYLKYLICGEICGHSFSQLTIVSTCMYK